MKITVTKEQLEGTKLVRQYGIDDLKRYKEKIKNNIKIFEEAIGKEKTEMKRVQEMINVLDDDIKQANILERQLTKQKPKRLSLSKNHSS